MPFPFQSSIDYPASSIRHTKRDPCSFSYWLKWISCNHAKKCNVKNIVIYLRFSSPLSCESFSVRIQVYCFDSIGSFKMYHNIYFHQFKKKQKYVLWFNYITSQLFSDQRSTNLLLQILCLSQIWIMVTNDIMKLHIFEIMIHFIEFKVTYICIVLSPKYIKK